MEGFRLIREGHCKKWSIESQKKYKIPASKIPVTHVYARAGKISFFASVNGERSNIKTKRGFFFAAPTGAKVVAFPEFNENPSGFHYGEPLWYAIKTC